MKVVELGKYRNLDSSKRWIKCSVCKKFKEDYEFFSEKEIKYLEEKYKECINAPKNMSQTRTNCEDCASEFSDKQADIEEAALEIEHSDSHQDKLAELDKYKQCMASSLSALEIINRLKELPEDARIFVSMYAQRSPYCDEFLYDTNHKLLEAPRNFLGVDFYPIAESGKY